MPHNNSSNLNARPGLLGRLLILGLLFLGEKSLLNPFVDFNRAQAAIGFGAFVREAQHWGFRFLVAMAAATLLLLSVNKAGQADPGKAAIRSGRLQIGWMALHVALFICLIPITYLLYRDEASSLPFPAVVVLWLALSLCAVLSAALAIAPSRLWCEEVRAKKTILLYAAVAAFAAASVMQVSRNLWAYTASATFSLVRRTLLPLVPTINADPVTHILSTQSFAVEVTEVCSGLEGMGLILAFSLAWLTYFRREYVFPRALLLIPIGLVLMFVLNVLRISALFLLGNAGFPDVAIYGFHSQAGWIAFISVACGLVYFSRKGTWLIRQDAIPANDQRMDNPTAAYLTPLLAILAAGILSHAVSAQFEIFYPVRVVAALLAFFVCRHHLRLISFRFSWRGPAVGIGVFIIWLIGAKLLLPTVGIPEALEVLPPIARTLWIASHVLGSVLIVPVAEELAYRGYLMRRIAAKDFESVPYGNVRWFALLISSVAFGLAHGTMWIPATVAGLAYGLVVKRSGNLGEGVAGHLVSNGLVASSVLASDMWQLW